mmetsp:Transcript_37820/g.57887  ORF Transcript_37820/g.57887 Transcript_37820/m.57887 type:complete len:306 (-) Transcript_37820:21-938(-)
MKDKPELQNLVEAITSYRMMLKLFSIEDSQVKLFKQSLITQIVLMLISLARLVLSFIFMLPGNIMTFPLSTAIAFYSERERIKALKKSTVKVTANDVLASIKILAYISTYPIYLMMFTFLFNTTLQVYFEFDRAQAYTYSTFFFFFFPIISVVSIRSHDGVRTHYTDFQGRFLSLFYTNQVEYIKSTRKALKRKVRAIVDKVGPQVFKNYDKMKIIMFDPSVGKYIEKERKEKMQKSQSLTKLQKASKLETKSNLSTNALPFKTEAGSSKPPSTVSMPKSATSEIDLDYLDEIELNEAFNVFKDI